MSNPIGKFTNYNPQNQKPKILHELQEEFGSELELLCYEQKIIFRGALANFIANKPVHQPSPHLEEVTLMQSCIEGAGVDWDVWDVDPDLCKYIGRCEDLDESDIEGLIAAITAQISSKTYSSRGGA